MQQPNNIGFKQLRYGKSNEYVLNVTRIIFGDYDTYKDKVTGIPGVNIGPSNRLRAELYQDGTTAYVLSKGVICLDYNPQGMFKNLTSLQAIEFINFSTARANYMNEMFSGCRSLKELDLSTFTNMSKVVYTSGMFSGCSSLTSLNLSSFDTSTIMSMMEMFSGCSSLTSLNLSSFDTSNVTNMTEMFSGCSNLTTIYVGDGWNVNNVTRYDNMFLDSTKLVGGNGTTYDSTIVDITYAHVDVADNPGYLTAKPTL